ncbi:MAG: TIGR03032 family protein, partial [Gammaproteobacteria bacterium]|nr:TIGR03032 family protein [Gammaproteobacteria bacterium]
VYVTGHLAAHGVGVDKQGKPLFHHTRYNCLATVSNRHSFEVLWKPPFISALVDEDRCHLNGMAMQDGKPRYVTAVSRSDTIDGWRDRRGNGGIVIDVESSEIVCTGLSMPHSPRIHNGELWLHNSGTGELGVVNFDSDGKGTFEPRMFCPGFLRGLAFHGNLAFVGLSKPRYKRFEGLELDQRLRDADSEPWCGIQIIDLTSGSCVDWLRIDGKIGELYDLEVIPGITTPMAVAPDSNEAAGLITFADE